jgi:hypothetical protein
MSFMDIVANVVTGGAYGAVTGNWGPETHETAPTPSTPSPPSTPPSRGIFGALADALAQPVRPPMGEATCCDRYRFNDGFLVDGVTGLVWRFDESKKAFVEVTRKPAEEKLPLITAVWEAQIQAVRKQYEAQLINTLSPELRDQAIKDFEKRFLKPIRDSAGLGT